MGSDSMATPRFLDALDYAVRLHGADSRKGSEAPYIAHLLGVCALVLLDGGSEDEAIAALLHDALEDHPEEVTRESLGARFGSAVLAIVEACTDTPPDYRGGKKPPWKQRKTAYLEHLSKSDPKALRVSLADKLDNIRSILPAYRRHGDRLWLKFNAGRDEQIWLVRSLRETFRKAGVSGFLMEEFERAVEEFEKLTAV